MEKRQLHTLDGLRGLAAGAVVLLHLHHWFAGVWAPPGAYLAVDFFFALSGFVLAEAYADRLDRGLSAIAFMGRRLRRLWPLYAFGLLIAAASLFVGGAAHREVWPAILPLILNLAYVPWPGPHGELYALNIPAWSLFYELLANVVMALAWRWLSGAVVCILMGICAIGLLASAWTLGSLDAGFTVSQAPVALCRVGFSFFLGISLWRMGPSRRRLNAWVLVCVLAICLAVAVPAALRPILDVVEVLLIFPAIIRLAAATEPAGLSLRLFEFVGAASYALYVIHVPLLGPLSTLIARALGTPRDHEPDWVAAPLFIGLILLAFICNEADVLIRRRWEARLRRT